MLSPSYLRFVCSLPCLIDEPTSPCSGQVGPHHVGHHGQARQNDYNAVPLCTAHHLNGFGPHAIHRIHQAAFEAHFGVSLAAAIARLNGVWESLTENQRRELAWSR